MEENQTLYGWLFKIAIVVVIILFVYLCITIDKKFPWFKNTSVFRYVITPIIYIILFVFVIYFTLF